MMHSQQNIKNCTCFNSTDQIIDRIAKCTHGFTTY